MPSPANHPVNPSPANRSVTDISDISSINPTSSVKNNVSISFASSVTNSVLNVRATPSSQPEERSGQQPFSQTAGKQQQAQNHMGNSNGESGLPKAMSSRSMASSSRHRAATPMAKNHSFASRGPPDSAFGNVMTSKLGISSTRAGSTVGNSNGNATSGDAVGQSRNTGYQTEDVGGNELSQDVGNESNLNGNMVQSNAVQSQDMAQSQNLQDGSGAAGPNKNVGSPSSRRNSHDGTESGAMGPPGRPPSRRGTQDSTDMAHIMSVRRNSDDLGGNQESQMSSRRNSQHPNAVGESQCSVADLSPNRTQMKFDFGSDEPDSTQMMSGGNGVDNRATQLYIPRGDDMNELFDIAAEPHSFNFTPHQTSFSQNVNDFGQNVNNFTQANSNPLAAIPEGSQNSSENAGEKRQQNVSGNDNNGIGKDAISDNENPLANDGKSAANDDISKNNVSIFDTQFDPNEFATQMFMGDANQFATQASQSQVVNFAKNWDSAILDKVEDDHDNMDVDQNYKTNDAKRAADGEDKRGNGTKTNDAKRRRLLSSESSVHEAEIARVFQNSPAVGNRPKFLLTFPANVWLKSEPEIRMRLEKLGAQFFTINDKDATKQFSNLGKPPPKTARAKNKTPTPKRGMKASMKAVNARKSGEVDADESESVPQPTLNTITAVVMDSYSYSDVQPKEDISFACTAALNPDTQISGIVTNKFLEHAEQVTWAMGVGQKGGDAEQQSNMWSEMSDSYTRFPLPKQVRSLYLHSRKTGSFLAGFESVFVFSKVEMKDLYAPLVVSLGTKNRIRRPKILFSSGVADTKGNLQSSIGDLNNPLPIADLSQAVVLATGYSQAVGIATGYSQTVGLATQGSGLGSLNYHQNNRSKNKLLLPPEAVERQNMDQILEEQFAVCHLNEYQQADPDIESSESEDDLLAVSQDNKRKKSEKEERKKKRRAEKEQKKAEQERTKAEQQRRREEAKTREKERNAKLGPWSELQDPNRLLSIDGTYVENKKKYSSATKRAASGRKKAPPLTVDRVLWVSTGWEECFEKEWNKVQLAMKKAPMKAAVPMKADAKNASMKDVSMKADAKIASMKGVPMKADRKNASSQRSSSSASQERKNVSQKISSRASSELSFQPAEFPHQSIIIVREQFLLDSAFSQDSLEELIEKHRIHFPG